MNSGEGEADEIQIPTFDYQVMTARLGENNNKTPVNAVTEAVAEATDNDPLDLPPLHEAVDPDALNTLFNRSGTSIQVLFQYAGLEVVVKDGEVEVEPLQEEF